MPMQLSLLEDPQAAQVSQMWLHQICGHLCDAYHGRSL